MQNCPMREENGKDVAHFNTGHIKKGQNHEFDSDLLFWFVVFIDNN